MPEGMLTRRRLLRLGAAGAGCVVAGGLPHALLGAIPSGHPPVLIVGAGLAGLAAALELDAMGVDSIVLEAREQPGGRVRTARKPLSDGLYADLGPWRIAAEHEETRDWARRLGLSLIDIGVEDHDLVYLLRGRRFDAEAAARDPALFPYRVAPDERQLGPAGLWERCFGPYTERDLDPFGAEWPADVAALDELSLGDFFRACGLSPEAFELVADAVQIRPFLHTAFLSNLREELHGFEGGFFAVAGGNDQLPSRMAARLGDRVRYGCEVVRVERGGARPAVVFRRDGAVERFEAERLVLAVPFSVLREIEVDPPFSEGKRRAIAELNYEGATKVLIESRDAAWRSFRPGAIHEYRTDLPLHQVRAQRHPWAEDRGLAVVYAMGKVPEYERLSRSELERAVIDDLRRARLVPLGEVAAVLSIHWLDEPYARGAYPVFLPGQEHELRPFIATAEGRVHFAGDHTSMAPGWMMGALRSGARVAGEVAASLPAVRREEARR